MKPIPASPRPYGKLTLANASNGRLWETFLSPKILLDCMRREKGPIEVHLEGIHGGDCCVRGLRGE